MVVSLAQKPRSVFPRLPVPRRDCVEESSVSFILLLICPRLDNVPVTLVLACLVMHTMSVEYSPEMAQAVFPDLSNPEEQKRYFEMMSNHSRVSFDGKLKHAGWKEVKSHYMHTKKDVIISPDLQLRIISGAKEQGADVEVIEIDAGHVPMLGRESEVCKLLVKAAGLQ